MSIYWRRSVSFLDMVNHSPVNQIDTLFLNGHSSSCSARYIFTFLKVNLPSLTRNVSGNSLLNECIDTYNYYCFVGFWNNAISSFLDSNEKTAPSLDDVTVSCVISVAKSSQMEKQNDFLKVQVSQ